MSTSDPSATPVTRVPRHSALPSCALRGAVAAEGPDLDKLSYVVVDEIVDDTVGISVYPSSGRTRRFSIAFNAGQSARDSIPSGVVRRSEAAAGGRTFDHSRAPHQLADIEGEPEPHATAPHTDVVSQWRGRNSRADSRVRCLRERLPTPLWTSYTQVEQAALNGRKGPT